MKPIDAVLGQPWAIEPEWLSMIAAVAQRQFDAPVVAAMQGNPPRAEAVTTANGIAVINLLGPIFPRANLMTENSGATSLDKVSGQFRAALADPTIKAIVLNVDSPGGVATGIADFAAEIRAARKSKPITAFVSGSGASAAYWIASAASSLVVASTAQVGSIGVVMGMSKQVAPDRNGEITVEIVSSNAPAKRPDIMDSAGRADIVSRLDALEAVFLQAVAGNRGVAVDKVKADFGRGGVRVGADAIAAGMADRIGTLDSVLTKLAAAGSVTRFNSRAAAAAQPEIPSMSNPNSIAELTAAFPELVTEIRKEAAAEARAQATDAAVKAGAKAERERLAGIEQARLPGHDALVQACKDDPECTPGMAALRINAAERAKLDAALSIVKGVEGKTAAVAASTAATRSDAPPRGVDQILADRNRTVDERCKEAWAIDESLRTEFGSLGAFTAYQSALEAGKVKRLTGRS